MTSRIKQRHAQLCIAYRIGHRRTIADLLHPAEKNEYRITELTGERESRGPGFKSHWLRVVFKLGWVGEQLNRAVKLLPIRQPTATFVRQSMPSLETCKIPG